jgi:hypothetical protein
MPKLVITRQQRKSKHITSGSDLETLTFGPPTCTFSLELTRGPYLAELEIIPEAIN